MTNYPNSDKLNDTDILFEFTDWLTQRFNIIDPVNIEEIIRRDDLVYQFLGIDKAELEQERRAILQEVKK